MESTMKFSSLMTKRIALSIALLATLNVAARSEALSTPRDYSFTISTTQPWTDTGVDLQAGDLLEISASPAPAAGGTDSSSAPCDPRGASGSTEANASLPVAAAPAGSLIARLQAQGEAVPVGNTRRLKVDVPGHLFFGVNAQAPPDCSGSFAVKVRISSRGSAAPAAVTGNALTSPSVAASAATSSSASSVSATSPATSAAAQSSVQSPAQTNPPPAQDIKSKLASAAQVFLAGQFGAGANPASSSAAPLSSDATPATAATSAASVPATPPLSVSDAALDSGLRKNIDELPRRVNDQFSNQGDMVNFVLVGSQQQVQSALEAANWHVADTDNKEAVLKAVLETYQKKDYLAMPMSQLYLFGRKQDFGYELAQAYSVVASRHHFRIWKAPNAWNGQTMWAGAGTHDIGFEKDQRNGSVTHKIDPAVDGERDNIGQTLQQAGKVKSMSYYLPPDPVQGAKNATGGGYRSDGRILVIVLQ
jgi:hypothetical protein